MNKKQKKLVGLLAILIALPLLATGCYKTVNTHGQVLYPSQLRQVTVGQSSKQDVLMLLGTPSTTGTMNDNRWYYITSTMTTKPLNPNVLDDRTVLVIDFDPSTSLVTAMGDKNKYDARDIEPDATRTETYGQKMGIVNQVFDNIGLGK